VSMPGDLNSFLADVLHQLFRAGITINVAGDFLAPRWIVVHADADINFSSPTLSPRATTMSVGMLGPGPPMHQCLRLLGLGAPYRVLERPPSPSSDRSVYRPMEPSNINSSLRGRRDCPCVVHDWDLCVNM
jgi:hypothetical protein